MVSKFLELDPEDDDVSTFLKDYVLPTTDRIFIALLALYPGSSPHGKMGNMQSSL